MILSILKSLFVDGVGERRRLDELDDRALMERYANGEADAFALLYGRHRGGVFNFILRSCGRQDVAEELLQEVFLKVVKSAPSYEPTAKFTTWLYRIARNACIDAARKRSRADLYSLNESPRSDDDQGLTHQDSLIDDRARAGGVDADRQAFRDRLQQALARLPETQREVFVLREISGLTFPEIAHVVDAKVPTIKSRMRYALKTLRGELADYKDRSFDDEEKLEMMPS